ncbi:RNA polymerase sigma factor [Elizabethkingia anophelis]|uniref:RNA polymerase sigma factor n=1 Tax=Elizabethkingia anophelis TaxID=1117645 RepID=UPI00099A4019|nr:RNA polymerase sigma factor [Elizabethkingia anophelis]MCT3662937.1 RNA polymerase sigma factor [Elizabethkingia anophelis]MCT4011163.1 RNA polymerase sigma factor [Elizabethkingia anophelis]MDV3898944.1 RNA polymerase sigma factor [Elizabethkingia anophelis]OPC51091.1 RNA polymerase subunit sigma-70 [Elizabethkingia anophelis]
MRILSKHKDDLVSLLKKHDPVAQRRFYEQQSPKLLSVSRTYIKDIYHAEDCLIKAFCKIFKNIESFRNDGSINAWARRIVVNECLSFLKSQKTIFYLDENQIADTAEDYDEVNIYEDFNVQELLDQLPENYRLVFNLYVLESYPHQEIAEMLNISVSTSKTQLFRAKAKLKEIFIQQKLIRNEIR